ncbi:MAG TPA: VOC family protein [Hymenobacter sp.]|jgi:PhnB protein|uniref:VOC family protein n=1 Tax=Hymenobacter sp. TaxID=1898978 RepID=UPI002EDB65F1
MASLAPYLSFPGNCREALAFYQSCLGGELNLMRAGDSPEAAAHVPAEAHDQIMHGSLTAGKFTLLASDALDPRHPHTPGSGVALCLNCSSDEEITNLFAKLGAGGTVTDPLADMFWGGKFGSLTDRFGMYWLFNFDKAPAQ